MDSWQSICDTALPLAALGYSELPWYGNALIATWLWCFGANVGSFMNVVVFRVPLGVSVVSPRSRCPKCRNGISWYDNIPMLSWLWLGARCRNCQTPISARYPTVEATVAAAFVVMGLFGPMASGANLPQVLVAPPLRLQLMHTLWLMSACHLLLLCTLICAALIEYDGETAPSRLFVPALLVGLAVPLMYPQMRPVPFHAPIALPDRWIAALDALTGVAVGASLGMLIPSQGIRRSSQRNRSRGTWYSGALIGLFLGWQAAVAVITSCTALWLAGIGVQRARGRPRGVPWTGWAVPVTIFFVLCWRLIHDRYWWLGARATILTFAVAFLLLGLARWFAGRREHEALESDDTERDLRGLSTMAPTHDPQTEAILNSDSYRLAERDTEFLCRPELRPVRLQLELLKPEMYLAEQGVHSTIVAFGGTQIVEQHEADERLRRAKQALADDPENPELERRVSRAERVAAKSKYYDTAREFARIVSSTCQANGDCDFVIVTGGGPGIMEAANRGAHDAGAKSIGLNITLPEEQAPNRYITPELCFQFHYFALRKMHFLFRAQALVVFPGGFGTLDELFDALTLRQTNRMQEIPIILIGREYWDQVIDFQFLADEGTIRDDHLDLISYAETPQEAWEIIAKFHSISPSDLH